MNNIYDTLIDLWETFAGVGNLPDYIDKILYYVTLLIMLLLVFIVPICIYLIFKFFKNIGGGFND